MRDPDEYEADALRRLQDARGSVGPAEWEALMREAQVYSILALAAAVDWARVRG